MSFQKLFLRYGGPTATLVGPVIGSGAVITEARSGRAHALNMTDLKLEAVQSQITEPKADIQDLGAEVQDLGAEMQATQSMILEKDSHIDACDHVTRRFNGRRNRSHVIRA